MQFDPEISWLDSHHHAPARTGKMGRPRTIHDHRKYKADHERRRRAKLKAQGNKP